jgi:hypothetical protein
MTRSPPRRRRRALIDPNDPTIKRILLLIAELDEKLARRDDPAKPPPTGWLTTDQAAELAHIGVEAMRLRCDSGAVVARLCRGERGVQWFIDPASVRPRRLGRGPFNQVGKRA